MSSDTPDKTKRLRIGRAQPRDWMVCVTEPRRESWAAENVERQGYEYYLPQILEKRVASGKLIEQTHPLFPGYLFVKRMTGGRWASLTGTRGVIQVITTGLNPSFLPNRLIDELRQKEKDGLVILPPPPDSAEFQPGQPVRLRDGPMLGYIGIYDGQARADRVNVLLKFLSGEIRVEVKATQLEKL